MVIKIIMGIILLYIVLCIYVIITAEEVEIEMFEGEPRYVHTGDGWYGEVELWDRKEEKFIYL